MTEQRWKCSHCGRMYSTDELLALPSVKAVEKEPDPTAGTGLDYFLVCKCGKVFTVHLELNHGFLGPELWYETMVMERDGADFLDYQDRYTTQAEAEAGHVLAISKVRSGAIHLYGR